MTGERLMSTREAAGLVGIKPATLRRLYAWNLAYQTMPDGSRRYRLADVLDYMARSGRIAQ